MRARKQAAVTATGGRSLAAIGAVMALASAWAWPLPHMARDLFAAHMFQHLLAMNVAALLIAVSARQSRAPDAPALGRWPAALPVITALQLAALWLWHLPAVFAAAHHSSLLQVLMQVSLFAAAAAFWRVILASGGQGVWRPIFALLVTAKVFCLLGAAFVFARRTLYPAFGSPERWGLSSLEDQQLAGLLMVSSCALVYVAAAIALFARWLVTVEALGNARPWWTQGSDAKPASN